MAKKTEEVLEQVIEQTPKSGGRWIRQPDGSLTREPREEALPAEPTTTEAKED